jgi:spore photoproduct lyase
VRLELRTKTDHVDGLLAAAPAENVVVSFTLCPPRQAARYDFRAASVDARIAAAVRCQRAGWRIGLRLDPIVAAAGWESEYDALLAELARRLDPAAVADASLGLLRFDADLGRIMRRRWPRLGAGTAEYARCPDSLSRPTRPVRSAVYRRLLGRLRAWLGEAVAVELCMESAAVRRDCGME